jgi:hypothetical protein
VPVPAMSRVLTHDSRDDFHRALRMCSTASWRAAILRGRFVVIAGAPDCAGVALEGRHGGERAIYHLPDEMLRCGVQFADGTKVTNVNSPASWDTPEPYAPRAVRVHRGRRWWGEASDHQLRSSRGYWLWPLPPPEPFTLLPHACRLKPPRRRRRRARPSARTRTTARSRRQAAPPSTAATAPGCES